MMCDASSKRPWFLSPWPWKLVAFIFLFLQSLCFWDPFLFTRTYDAEKNEWNLDLYGFTIWRHANNGIQKFIINFLGFLRFINDLNSESEWIDITQDEHRLWEVRIDEKEGSQLAREVGSWQTLLSDPWEKTYNEAQRNAEQYRHCFVLRKTQNVLVVRRQASHITVVWQNLSFRLCFASNPSSCPFHSPGTQGMFLKWVSYRMPFLLFALGGRDQMVAGFQTVVF